MILRRIPLRKLVLILMTAILLVSSVPLPGNGGSTASPLPAYAESDETQFPVLGVLGFLSGLRARNRVYRDAEAWISERNQYYDALRVKAREQIENREIRDLGRHQIAAYRKMVTLIELERKASNDYAEAQKQQARANFHKNIENIVITRMLGSGAAQDLFRAMSKGINSSQDLLRALADKIDSGSGEFLEEAKKASTLLGRVNAVSTLVSGGKGNDIGRLSANLANILNKPQEEIRAAIEQVSGDLNQLSAVVSELQQFGREITASQFKEAILVRLVEGQSGDPVIDAVLDAMEKRAGVQGGSFRERARAVLNEGFIARCSSWGADYRDHIRKMQEDPNQLTEFDTNLVAACNGVDYQQLRAQADQDIGEGAIATSGDASLALLDVRVTKAWCWPAPSEGMDNNCSYTISWEVAYDSAVSTATVQCGVFNDTFPDGGIKYGEGLPEISGVWEHTTTSGGFYPGLGEYTERTVCELWVPDHNGEKLIEVEAEFDVVLDRICENGPECVADGSESETASYCSTDAECVNEGLHTYAQTKDDFDLEGQDDGAYAFEIEFLEDAVRIRSIDFGWENIYPKVEDNVYLLTGGSSGDIRMTFTETGYIAETIQNGNLRLRYTRTLIE